MNDERPDEVPPLITRRIRSGAVVAAGLLVVLAVVPAVLLGAGQAGAVLLGVLGVDDRPDGSAAGAGLGAVVSVALLLGGLAAIDVLG